MHIRDVWRFKTPVAALICYSWHHNALNSGISILLFYISKLIKQEKVFLPNRTMDKTSGTGTVFWFAFSVNHVHWLYGLRCRNGKTQNRMGSWNRVCDEKTVLISP